MLISNFFFSLMYSLGLFIDYNIYRVYNCWRKTKQTILKNIANFILLLND